MQHRQFKLGTTEGQGIVSSKKKIKLDIIELEVAFKFFIAHSGRWRYEYLTSDERGWIEELHWKAFLKELEKTIGTEIEV